MTTGPYTDIDFVLSGSNGRGDFIGISGSALDKAGIGVFTCESGSVNFLSKSAGTMLNVYNGPYQYPSWQQVRNLYNPIVRKLVEESILSLINPSNLQIDVHGDQMRANRGTVSCYKEPVVSGQSRPLIHSVVAQPNINQPDVVTSSFTYTYDNNLSSFTNPAIRNRLGINISDQESMYRNLSELYLDTLERTLDTNPIREFVSLNYSQILYPSPMNAYLNRTRSRTNYAEVAGTGSDGYDRIFGHQRTFFKEDEIRTLGTASNSQGYVGVGYAYPISYTSSFQDDNLFPAAWLSDRTSNVACTIAGNYVPNRKSSGSYCFKFGGMRNDAVDERYLQYRDYVTNPTTGPLTVAFILMYNYTFQNKTDSCPPNWNTAEDGDPLRIQYRTDTGSWTDFPEATLDAGVTAFSPAVLDHTTITASGSTGIWFINTVTASVDLATEAPGEQAQIRIAQPEWGVNNDKQWHLDTWAIQRITMDATYGGSNVDFLNFSPMATDGIRSFPNSSSYRNYDGELMGDTDESLFGDNPQPSMAFTEQTHLANEKDSVRVEGDYVETLVSQMAGKNAWYDSYEGYDIGIRNRGKGMSIVPEFRISDFMEYYINLEGKNIRAKNDKFLLLDGATITASADSESGNLDSTFLSRYVESSAPSRLYGKIASHEDIATLSRIKLSCKGIKKLLPYNGFYPQSRTIQLGNLLSQSMGAHIKGYKGSTQSSAYYPQALQGLLKPLISPGILYNSIKAGMAVDYPVYTGTVPGIVEGEDLPADFNLKTAPNYRIPFEALLNLKDALPSIEAVLVTEDQADEISATDPHVTLVSSFATFQKDFTTEELFDYSFTWDGTKTPLFELGMHNFLAETVDFFLEDGRLTSYRSEPQPSDLGWHFEKNKTYYMDVAMTDTVEMNKFVEYVGFKAVDVNPVMAPNNTLFELPLHDTDWDGIPLQGGRGLQNGHFGASVSIVEGGPNILWALAGAPNNINNGDDSFITNGGVAYLYRNDLTTPTGWQQRCILTGGYGDYVWPGETTGFSVSLASSSKGLYALVGNSETRFASTPNTGSAYLYHITDASLEKQITYWQNDSLDCALAGHSDEDDWCQLASRYESVTKLTASDGFAGNFFGFSADVSVDPATENVYCLVGAPVWEAYDGDAGATGSAYLYRVNTSPGFTDIPTTELKLEPSVGAIKDQFGTSVSVVSGNAGVYCLVGAPWLNKEGSAVNQKEGMAFLYHSASSGFAIPGNEQKLTASDASSLDWFGFSTSVASGTDGLYCFIGAPGQDGLGDRRGAGYLYQSASSGFAIPGNEQKLTASNGDDYQYNGYKVEMVSGTTGITMAMSDWPTSSADLDITDTYATIFDEAPSDQTGSVWFFHSASFDAGFDGITEQYTASLTPVMSGGFGSGVSLISGSNAFYSVIGENSGSTQTITNSGIATLYTGSVGTMTAGYEALEAAEKYKQHGKLFGMGIGGTMDPAYAAYTPPCMYGEAIARISFNAGPLEGPRKLDEIFANATVENILNVDNSKCAVINQVTRSLSDLAAANKMSLESSVNLFGKFFQPGVTYDASTNTAMSINQDANLNPAWVISTKFESPVLDVSSSKYDEFYTSHNDLMKNTYAWNESVVAAGHNLPQTIWSSYGKVPKGSKGIYFTLKESYPNVSPLSTETGSLIKTCGFTPYVEGYKIGKVAQTKTISEAVVVIPYSDVEIRQRYQVDVAHTSDRRPDPTEAITVFSEAAQKNFFRIPKGNFELQRDYLKSHGVAVPGEFNTRNLGVAVTRTTISDMITMMEKYVIPPNLDFVKYGDIDPFVMYIFEFEHVLKQQELSDIWQGVMPESAIKMVEDEIIIDHNFDVLEFFGNVADPKIFGDMKYFVFKVKKRAKYNYYKTTEDATDDARFNYQFAGNPVDSAIGLNVSYNWPYDFFSLVENIEVQSSVSIKKKVPPPPPPDESEGQI